MCVCMCVCVCCCQITLIATGTKEGYINGKTAASLASNRFFSHIYYWWIKLTQCTALFTKKVSSAGIAWYHGIVKNHVEFEEAPVMYVCNCNPTQTANYRKIFTWLTQVKCFNLEKKLFSPQFAIHWNDIIYSSEEQLVCWLVFGWLCFMAYQPSEVI